MERVLLRVEEAAEVAGLSRAQMYKLVLSGVVPSIKVGRSRRVLRASLEAWAQEQLAAQRPAGR